MERGKNPENSTLRGGGDPQYGEREREREGGREIQTDRQGEAQYVVYFTKGNTFLIANARRTTVEHGPTAVLENCQELQNVSKQLTFFEFR